MKAIAKSNKFSTFDRWCRSKEKVQGKLDSATKITIWKCYATVKVRIKGRRGFRIYYYQIGAGSGETENYVFWITDRAYLNKKA